MSIDFISNPDSLTPRVLQVSDALGLYGAELARILHLHCNDIGAMSAAKKLLTQEMDAWLRAALLVDFYHDLYILFQANDVAIYHWLRARNVALMGIPLMLIVDEDKLATVAIFIKHELKKSTHACVNEPF